jgi:hypothetical protein
LKEEVEDIFLDLQQNMVRYQHYTLPP